ncbi:hypothetical protein H257_02953 [Aphanomyces astaci]|uniref:Uncharacterized protein n=1 Tax=Aphanomyces astaci TaxID=112090 RepID=W4H1H9_APHAT|nr:hypothetical protein H257_02953 [Aphanomyces astaci]ETV85094.1 hypothetical protein H257_02953 [Aphanomyces astaci]RQM25527.1 hypothetical protein B5M09_013399 [Aphanomyces astaci]|eukprot:XP_009825112.1 hypothetical protein H257_02953 [Aphanomyces astaci]
MPPANAFHGNQQHHGGGSSAVASSSEYSQHSHLHESSQPPEEYEIDHQLLARYERLNHELEQMSRLQRSRHRNHSWDRVDSTRAGSRTMSGIFSSRGGNTSTRVTSARGSSRGMSFRMLTSTTPSERSGPHTMRGGGGLFSSSRGGGMYPPSRCHRSADRTVVGLLASTRAAKVEIPTPYEEEWVALSKELEKARKMCIEKRAVQSDLLEKIEKYETSAIRRFFAVNKEKRVEKLKGKLSKQLQEAEAAEESLLKLERRSMSMSEVVHHFPPPSMSYTSMRGASSKSLHDPSRHVLADPLDVELHERQELLEQEKRDILNNVFNAFVVPDVNRLKAHIAVAKSELKAGESVKKQVDEVYAMYRAAFSLLRAALASIVGNAYQHSMKEFIQGPYPQAIEAGRLVEGAGLLIQPEAKRKYPDFAPTITGIQLPKFPTSMKDLARPGALLTMEPGVMESADMDRRLKRAESVIVKMQQLVNRNLECLEQWRGLLEKDRHQAEATGRSLEAQLDKKMNTFVHSMAA